jgi:hypothetical protein
MWGLSIVDSLDPLLRVLRAPGAGDPNTNLLLKDGGGDFKTHIPNPFEFSRDAAFLRMTHLLDSNAWPYLRPNESSSNAPGNQQKPLSQNKEMENGNGLQQ